MMVEDDDFSTSVVQDILSGDHDILRLADGYAALQTLLSHPPGLVLLDVEMPALCDEAAWSGTALLDQLRRV